MTQMTSLSKRCAACQCRHQGSEHPPAWIIGIQSWPAWKPHLYDSVGELVTHVAGWMIFLGARASCSHWRASARDDVPASQGTGVHRPGRLVETPTGASKMLALPESWILNLHPIRQQSHVYLESHLCHLFSSVSSVFPGVTNSLRGGR